MDLTAVVSSASNCGDLWSPGHDGTRAWGANRLARPQGPPELSAYPHAGQSRFAIFSLSQCSRRLVYRSISDLPHGFEEAVTFPNGPGDPCELVGESEGGFVVSSRALTLKCPRSEPIRVIDVLCGPQNGPGAVKEEHTEIGIAPLGDTAEMAA